MATLTIRNIEDDLKSLLRMNAARHGWSMEEEVRKILRQACRAPDSPGLGSKLAGRFAALGGVELPAVKRSLPRPGPDFLEESGA